MPIDKWLQNISQNDSGKVSDDLNCLAGLDYPFLSIDQSGTQIARLSAHLGKMQDDIRRLVISYSLYVRQLDAIQEHLIKNMCKSNCGRPPVGCCNANHYNIFSMSDLMISRPSSKAMQLSDSIFRMQREENGFHGYDSTRVAGYCDYLTTGGCTLRLFKSPLCIHYLCKEAQDSLKARFHKTGAAFVEGMRDAASRTISVSTEFVSPSVIAAATVMLAGDELFEEL